MENGRVCFRGDASAIADANIRLRTADRILIVMAQFPASDFDQLFQGTREAGWEDHLPVNARMHVLGKSVRSTLHGVPACQSIVKKAIVEAMKRKYRKDRFEESGPEYRIEVAILKDRATLTMDTSGQGLHKRGYRKGGGGEAPLKETLAAGLVLLSRWRHDHPLADPLCGSGTIAIEAAMIARNLAPGAARRFAAEAWPAIPGKVWQEARDRARAVVREGHVVIAASDRDGGILRQAEQNARSAGVGGMIRFRQKELAEFSPEGEKGTVVCNPPYGERMGQDPLQVEETYRTLGRLRSTLGDWSLFFLSAYPHVEKMMGRRADRKRKLYNGRILCYYYQYYSEPGITRPKKA